MRQGEIRGIRSADSDLLLLLYELPRSRTPVRAADFRAAVLDPDSGTGFILYRKDRVHCVTGQGNLEEHRLKPNSPTRRVVATCCNSAMFLDFTKGHWLSMYRNRFPTGAPPLQMRVMTKERRVGVKLADDLPNYSGRSGTFMLKLIAAWIAMGLRRPEFTSGKTAPRAQ
jgi:hypothetical protein